MKRTNDGKRGGLLKGDSHDDGGIKAVVVDDNNRPIEVEGEEAIVNKKSMKDQRKFTISGTPAEIVSAVNTIDGNGVVIDSGAELTNHETGKTQIMEDGGTIYHVSSKKNLKKTSKPFHAGTLSQAETRADHLNLGNDANYYMMELPKSWNILKAKSDTEANIKSTDKKVQEKYDAISYPNAVEGKGLSYIIFSHIDVKPYVSKKEKGGTMEKSDKFEQGTPVTIVGEKYDYDLKKKVPHETSGEVIIEDGIKKVSLYPDANYSGSSRRIVNPDWSKVKKWYKDGGVAGYEDLYGEEVVDIYNAQQLEIGEKPEATENMFSNPTKKFATGGLFAERSTKNWNDVPFVWRNTKKVKRVNYELEPNNKGLETVLKPFIGQDDLRPVMSGIYFSETHITCTDAHRLISIPHITPESETGIYPTQATLAKAKKSEYLASSIKDGKIEGKFPNVQPVIPNIGYTVKSSYQFDVYKLYQYTKSALNYTNKTSHQIAFKVNAEENIGFNGNLLVSVLKSMLEMGHEKMWFHFSDPKTGGVFTSEKDYTYDNNTVFMLMPIMIYGAEETGLGATDLDFEKSLSVYFDFSKNAIINADGTEANFEMNYGESDTFSKPLMKLIKQTIPKTTSLPILETFKVQDKTLLVTDLENTVIVNDINLPNGLYEQDNGSFMQSDKDIADYPKRQVFGTDMVADFKVDADYLKWVFDTTVDFAGQDDLRPVMSGVNIQHTYNGVSFAATNAHYIARIDASEHVSLVTDQDFSIILPKKVLKSFIQFADSGDVSIKSDGVITILQSDKASLITRNIDGKYPNYEAVMPEEYVNKITVSLAEFKKCTDSKESKDFFKKMKDKADFFNLSGLYEDGKLVVTANAETDYRDEERNLKMKKLEDLHLCSISASKETGSFNMPRTALMLMPVLGSKGEDFAFAPKLLKVVLDQLSGDQAHIYSNEKNRGFGFFGEEFEYKKKAKKPVVAKKKKPATASEPISKITKGHIVEDINNGKKINKIWVDWNNIKTDEEHKDWSTYVYFSQFGSYHDKTILDIIDNFEPVYPNEVLKKDFLKELKKALTLSNPKKPSQKFKNSGDGANKKVLDKMSKNRKASKKDVQEQLDLIDTIEGLMILADTMDGEEKKELQDVIDGLNMLREDPDKMELGGKVNKKDYYTNIVHFMDDTPTDYFTTKKKLTDKALRGKYGDDHVFISRYTSVLIHEGKSGKKVVHELKKGGDVKLRIINIHPIKREYTNIRGKKKTNWTADLEVIKYDGSINTFKGREFMNTQALRRDAIEKANEYKKYLLSRGDFYFTTPK